MEEYNYNVEELYLYTVNDGDLYRNKVIPIINNLAKKMFAGKYDKNLAVKAWMYLVEDGLRKYNKEFPEEPLRLTKDEKNQVALKIQDRYEEFLQETYEKLKAEKKKSSLGFTRVSNLSQDDMDEILLCIDNTEYLYDEIQKELDIIAKKNIKWGYTTEDKIKDSAVSRLKGFIYQALKEDYYSLGFNRMPRSSEAERKKMAEELYERYKDDLKLKTEELKKIQGNDSKTSSRKPIGRFVRTERKASVLSRRALLRRRASIIRKFS